MRTRSIKKTQKEITQQDVLIAMQKIVAIMNDGYSILYARKKVCGGQNTRICRAVVLSDLYLSVLNKYMKEKTNSHFVRINGRLVCKKNPKGGLGLGETFSQE